MELSYKQVRAAVGQLRVQGGPHQKQDGPTDGGDGSQREHNSHGLADRSRRWRSYAEIRDIEAGGGNWPDMDSDVSSRRKVGPSLACHRWEQLEQGAATVALKQTIRAHSLA